MRELYIEKRKDNDFAAYLVSSGTSYSEEEILIRMTPHEREWTWTKAKEASSFWLNLLPDYQIDKIIKEYF